MMDNEHGNPRISQIDAYWDRIYPALNNRSGTAARDALRDLRGHDTQMFNALYRRIDQWMRVQFSAAPMSKSEKDRGYTTEEVGVARMAEFIVDRKTGDWWQSADLPRIIAEMPKG
jgi:hypothetical protein